MVLQDVHHKLFTPEDPFNVHKLLGVCCLVSFAVRFLQVGKRDMGFDTSISTPLTIVMHLLLSVSSLVFRIPIKRMKGAWRIWPEYRFHSVAFASRSLASMLLTWLEAYLGMESPNYAANVVIVLGTCAAADWGSHVVGEANRSHTIRDLDTSPAARYFFSVMQLYATTASLTGLRRYSPHFLMLFIVQCNAFLMTMQRKNIATHGVLVTVYGMMLAFGLLAGLCELEREGLLFFDFAVANLAVLLRIGLNVNKYVLWSGMGVLLQLVRPTAGAAVWLPFTAISFAAVIYLGWIKSQYGVK